jgi:xylan 1,4-beta-xylosidase
VRRVAADAGRWVVDVALGRHGIALVEVAGAPDQAPAWTDDARLLGAAASPGGADSAGPGAGGAR